MQSLRMSTAGIKYYAYIHRDTHLHRTATLKFKINHALHGIHAPSVGEQVARPDRLVAVVDAQ